MVHDRNTLPMDHMFSVNSTIQGCHGHQQGVDNDSKKFETYFWPKYENLRFLEWFLKNVLAHHDNVLVYFSFDTS